MAHQAVVCGPVTMPHAIGALPSHSVRNAFTSSKDPNFTPSIRGRSVVLNNSKVPDLVSPVTYSRGRHSPYPTQPLSVTHLTKRLWDEVRSAAACWNAFRKGKSTANNSNLSMQDIRRRGAFARSVILPALDLIATPTSLSFRFLVETTISYLKNNFPAVGPKSNMKAPQFHALSGFMVSLV
jgi:hypothetical protein